MQVPDAWDQAPVGVYRRGQVKYGRVRLMEMSGPEVS